MVIILERIAMKRILGVEKKNRIRVDIRLEKELVQTAKENTIHLSDTLNVLLEKELIEKKLL